MLYYKEAAKLLFLFPGDSGAVVLQVPSRGRAAPLLGGQQGFPHAVHRRGAQGRQGLRQGPPHRHAHRGGLHEGEEKREYGGRLL